MSHTPDFFAKGEAEDESQKGDDQMRRDGRKGEEEEGASLISEGEQEQLAEHLGRQAGTQIQPLESTYF